jgi:cell division protein FtsL
MSTATLVARRNQNLYRQPAKLTMGPTSATFVVTALVAVLALLYLNQITKTSVFGYKVSSLTAQLNQIKADQQDLSVEAARLSSIQAVQQSAVAKAMVPTSQITYAR